MGLLDIVANIIEKQIIDRALNQSGQHKDIFCETCRRVTDHVSISHAKSLTRAYRDGPRAIRGFAHVVGRVSDLNPMTNLFHGRPYRCSQCGKEVMD